MDIDMAKEIAGSDDRGMVDLSQKNCVGRGLAILAKYEDDVTCYFEHDIIYATDFDECVPKMSEEDFNLLLALGWFYDEDTEHWAHC